MAEPRKPNINTAGLDVRLAKVMEPVKQSIDMLTGARLGELKGLPRGASSEEVILKINEIVARLNASGRSNV